MELRAARLESGKTQAEVAREVGIANSAYQLYEYNKHEPSVRTAIRIASSVNSTVEKLWGSEADGGRAEQREVQKVPETKENET